MRKLISMMLAVALIGMIAGCSSMSRDIFDKDGKKIAHEEFSGDAIGMISSNLKDKIVFDYVSGTFIYFKVTPPAQDEPTGAVKIGYESGQVGHLTIPKDTDMKKLNDDAIAKMISATTGKDVSVTASGVNTGTPPPAK